MSVSGIAPTSVTAYTPPTAQQQQQQPVKVPQKAATIDTVSISQQAQKLASDGDIKAQEVKATGAESAGEKLTGKA